MAKSAIVIGAGIVGLAAARALAIRGYKVRVIERSGRAVGASIRNFGMIWPIGQPMGELYERAMLSKSIWKNICDETGTWYEEKGSLHVAYAADELDVLEEFAESMQGHRNCRLLSATETIERSEAIVKKHLQGALWSGDEMIVDPRKAIEAIPRWLHDKYGVEFTWGRAVTGIRYPSVFLGDEEIPADRILVCSGADFETLYPELYAAAPLTKCKLQMMRAIAQPDNWRIGPALCGALSLIHYKSFAVATSLQELRQRFENEYAEYLKWGIHVMVSQNEAGELTIGDSHEYGLTHDPFDKHFINEMILSYLAQFVQLKDSRIVETWNGIYPKPMNEENAIILEPEAGVMLVNGLGGAGMTLSFGLLEQVIGSKEYA